MAGYELLKQLGVFVREDFFRPEEVASIRAEVDPCERKSGGLEKPGKKIVDETIQKTRIATVSPAAKQIIEERICTLQGELEQNFTYPRATTGLARRVLHT